MRLCDEMRQVKHFLMLEATTSVKFSGFIPKAIISQQFQEFVQSFVRKQFPNNKVPEWLREGLSSAEIAV